jgi:hypothetical protein
MHITIQHKQSMSSPSVSASDVHSVLRRSHRNSESVGEDEDDDLPGAPQVFDKDALRAKMARLPVAFGQDRREVATDADFADIVLLEGSASKQLTALVDHDHCVKVRVTDLSPATRYFYRFSVVRDGERRLYSLPLVCTLPGAPGPP